MKRSLILDSGPTASTSVSASGAITPASQSQRVEEIHVVPPYGAQTMAPKAPDSKRKREPEYIEVLDSSDDEPPVYPSARMPTHTGRAKFLAEKTAACSVTTHRGPLESHGQTRAQDVGICAVIQSEGQTPSERPRSAPNCQIRTEAFAAHTIRVRRRVRFCVGFRQGVECESRATALRDFGLMVIIVEAACAQSRS